MKTKSLMAAGAAILFTVAVSVAGESARPMVSDDGYTSNYQDTTKKKKDKKKDTTQKRDTSYLLQQR